jgi:hypothetical protein
VGRLERRVLTAIVKDLEDAEGALWRAAGGAFSHGDGAGGRRLEQLARIVGSEAEAVQIRVPSVHVAHVTIRPSPKPGALSFAQLLRLDPDVRARRSARGLWVPNDDQERAA